MRMMEQNKRLRYSRFCIRSSALSDLLLVSHEALPTMQQRLPMIIYIYITFVLNQEHGVNKERWQSIQSFRHSKRTHRMWPHKAWLQTWSTRSRYLIRARCVDTPGKKTPSLLGGEGWSHSLAVAWARKSSPRFFHTRRDSLE